MDNDNLFPEIELAPAYKQNKLTKRNDVIQEYKRAIAKVIWAVSKPMKIKR